VCVCVCERDSGLYVDESYLVIRLPLLVHVDDVPGLGTIPSAGIHKNSGVIPQLLHCSVSSYNIYERGTDRNKTHQIQLFYRLSLMNARVLVETLWVFTDLLTCSLALRNIKTYFIGSPDFFFCCNIR
jgi:hypothetical protein